MVNSTMAAKRLKLQRQIRALPRRLPNEAEGNFTEHSVAPIPARLKAEGVRAPMAPIRGILQNYRNSANSLKTDMGQADEDCLRIYGRLWIGIPPGRKEAQEHLERLRSVSPELHSFTILENRVQRARVFYNATKTKFIISHELYREGIIRTSMAYMFRKNIIDDFRNGKLIWVEIRNSD